MHAPVSQVRGKSALDVILLVVFLGIPQVRQERVQGTWWSVRQLHGRRVGECVDDEALRLLPSLILHYALTRALGGEELELASPGPICLMLEVVRLLERREQQHVVGVVLGAIEAVGRVDEFAQAFKTHEGSQVITKHLHQHLYIGAVELVHGRAQKGEVSQEGMLVESL